jgi:hypothetical protein
MFRQSQYRQFVVVRDADVRGSQTTLSVVLVEFSKDELDTITGLRKRSV